MILDLTESAIRDLRAISKHTRTKWGSEQERRYLKQLYTRFQQILESPASYRFREDLFPDCQVAIEGRHQILFQVKNDSLLVVRILHEKMSIERHFAKGLDDSDA